MQRTCWIILVTVLTAFVFGAITAGADNLLPSLPPVKNALDGIRKALPKPSPPHKRIPGPVLPPVKPIVQVPPSPPPPSVGHPDRHTGRDGKDDTATYWEGYWAGYAAGQAGATQSPHSHPASAAHRKGDKDHDGRDDGAEYEEGYRAGYIAGQASLRRDRSQSSLALANACGNELRRYCANVPAEVSKQKTCLNQYLTLLSPACRERLAEGN